MSNTASAIEEPHAEHELESAEGQLGKYSGIVLPLFDPTAAIALLDSLRNGDPEEQRETFAVLEAMERERERLRRLAIPGFTFEPIDVEEAYRLLDQLDEFDPAEQRETFAYLREALNAERAANACYSREANTA